MVCGMRGRMGEGVKGVKAGARQAGSGLEDRRRGGAAAKTREADKAGGWR